MFAEQHKLALYEKKPNCIGQKLSQALPDSILSLQSFNKLKATMREFLLERCLYSIDEFWNSSRPNPT